MMEQDQISDTLDGLLELMHNLDEQDPKLRNIRWSLINSFQDILWLKFNTGNKTPARPIAQDSGLPMVMN